MKLISISFIFLEPSIKVEVPCKCQAWATCAWSKQMVDQITGLPKENDKLQPLSKQFALQVCDQEKKHVFCCRGLEPASQSELKQLQIMKPTESTIEIEGKIHMGINFPQEQD